MSNLRSSSPADQDDDVEPPTKQKKLEHYADHQVAEIKIDDLPEECLLIILSFLTMAELVVAQNVCSQWKRVSHFPILLRDKTFCVDETDSDAEVISFLEEWPDVGNVVMKRPVEAPVINALCRRCRRLKTLRISPCQKISNSLLKKFVKICANIQSLTIPHTLLDDQNKALVGQLRRLQSLEILESLEFVKSLKISYSSGGKRLVCLGPLADRCPELAVINISARLNVSMDDLKYFINIRGKALTHITLPCRSFCERCVVPLLEQCTSLIYLELHKCCVTDGGQKAFAALGNLHNLRSLTMNDLYDCPAGSLALAFTSGGLSRLEVLKISYGYGLEDSDVVAVCKYCAQLKELYLRRCVSLTDAALTELPRLNELETLDLSSCRRLRGEGLRCVSQLPKLRKLLLESCDLYEFLSDLECILSVTSLEILSLAFTINTLCFPFVRIPTSLVNLRLLYVEEYEVPERILQLLKQQMPSLKVCECNYTERDNDIQR